MKRFLIVFLVCVMAMCLSGCMFLPAVSEIVAPKQFEQEEAVMTETPEPVVEADTPVVAVTPEPTDEPTAQPVLPQRPEFLFDASLEVYDVSAEAYVRSTGTGEFGKLNELGENEFFTPVLKMEYNGEGTLRWNELYVTLDDGEKWGWTAGELPSGGNMALHIYYSNMQHVGEGTHTARWYLDGEEIYEYTFTLQRDLNWAALTELPMQEEIQQHNASATLRSPYMAVWLDVPGDGNYTEYQIDFKADYAPRGSYYAISNFMMDYSAVERQYEKVYTEYGITGYAGFQNLHNGDKVCIMSIWDLYCQDENGNVTTVRAKPTYPQDAYKSGEFGGEGVGAQCIVEYDWQENRWYRAHLKCYDLAGGNTQLEFWVTDLTTGKKTLLCAYDLGISGTVFRGDNCIFLENFVTGYSGDVRTMEVRKAKYLPEGSESWQGITKGDMYANGGALIMNYEGSFDYGVSGDKLWIMTTGVGDRQDVSAGKQLNFDK